MLLINDPPRGVFEDQIEVVVAVSPETEEI
jgi:hypothetical protein